MATAPRIHPELSDEEIGRKVFIPKRKTDSPTNLEVEKLSPRNPKEAIKRFEEEKAYGLGRRRYRKSRKLRRKNRKTRKH